MLQIPYFFRLQLTITVIRLSGTATKKRTVKFYEGRKLILLVQIIRCTVIHEDQTEEHHYHELLPDILLPFLQYTAASFAILKYSSDKAANMAEQDKPIWCRLITTEQWSVYCNIITERTVNMSQCLLIIGSR
jgi:hypothetical protein